ADRRDTTEAPVVGDAAKAGGVGDDRRRAASERFDACNDAAFGSAAEHQKVRRSMEKLDLRLRFEPEEMDALFELSASGEPRPDPLHFGRRLIAAPQLESRQPGECEIDRIENGQRILVRVEVACPEDHRVAEDASLLPGLLPIAGHKRRRALEDLED